VDPLPRSENPLPSNRCREFDYLQRNVKHANKQHRGRSSNGMLSDLRTPDSYHVAKDSRRWIPPTPTMQPQGTILAVPAFPPRSTNTSSRMVFDRCYKFAQLMLMLSPKAAGTTPTMERTRICYQPTRCEVNDLLRRCCTRAH
jgi:hypothetical protein